MLYLVLRLTTKLLYCQNQRFSGFASFLTNLDVGFVLWVHSQRASKGEAYLIYNCLLMKKGNFEN